jgi:hypothetical protein
MLRRFDMDRFGIRSHSRRKFCRRNLQKKKENARQEKKRGTDGTPNSPSGQWQTNSPTLSSQTPPFLQGLLSHSSMFCSQYTPM